ncbi:MAG: CxxC-x17-CxxC domain-containing protein [Candidatus Poseidoniia archaeon]|jgi:CxxC-x17-CxxC domain-containing protein
MTAAAGDFVTPGSSVIVPDGVEAGDGIHSDASGSMAVVTGTLVQSNDTISVDPSRPSVNSPQMGDIIIAEVNRLNPKTAEVRLLHIEGKDGGHRTVPAEELFADIFVTNFVDRFLPSAGDAMRKRDIVRARIVELDPMLKATTRDNPELGVLHALCPQCGVDLEASSKTPDFNVACPRCDYTGYRVLSNGFGHGHVLGDDIQSLNRPGARWSSEAEPMLGHDGARPYLSPVADYRRGMSHEMPDSVRRQRAAQSRGGGGGGRGGPRREMHPTTCTLCGTKTQVPFKPTPGKPIRCRDCMDKVKDGKASKDELAKERKVLNAARAGAEGSMGLKLFIGGVSYDATEDDLREAFSAHGELKEVHIATDKETGRSKGFAFITFPNKKDGLAAIKALHESKIHGRKISVQESNPGGRDRKRRPRRN